MLTPKQEKFCVEYVKCSNASEAYRVSYNAEKSTPKSVNELASKLLANAKVASRVKELQAPAAERARITLDSHLDRLEALSIQSESARQFGAAISAEVSRGKAVGIYVDRVQVDMKVDINEVETKIAALMAKLSGGRASRR